MNLARELVRSWFQLHPHLATEKGYPGLNGETADYRAASVENFLSHLAGLSRELNGASSSLEHQLLRGHLEAMALPFSESEVLERCPVFYLKAGLDGLESLQLRTDPLDLKSYQARLQGIEPLLEVAMKQLREPASPSYETALEMAEEAISELGSSGLSLPPEIAQISDRVRSRLDRFRSWLARQDPTEFRPMGEERFRQLVTTEHHLPDLLKWRARARQSLTQLEETLERLTPTHRSEAPAPTLTRAELSDYFRSELERVRLFVEESGIVSVPQGELRLCQTPPYLQALIPGAFYLEPAVFAGERVGRFYLPPLPEEWSEEVMARYRARKESGGFANLVVHEAWPGHHLHFLHAAENHHPLHNFRDNDLTIEGWALYCEELLDERGLHPRSPFPPRLRSLHLRLVRVLVDVAIHCGEMSLKEAEALMLTHLQRSLGPGVSRDWVHREVRRYALEPGQAMSYWVGAQMIRELRQELEVDAAGLRQFHDRFLSYGPIPLPLIREQMRSKP